MNDTGLGPAVPLPKNRASRYKLRLIKLRDAKGGGRDSKSRRNDIQRVEEIDQLIPEEFDEKRF